jgi:hypothetical protein
MRLSGPFKIVLRLSGKFTAINCHKPLTYKCLYTNEGIAEPAQLEKRLTTHFEHKIKYRYDPTSCTENRSGTLSALC